MIARGTVRCSCSAIGTRRHAGRPAIPSGPGSQVTGCYRQRTLSHSHDTWSHAVTYAVWILHNFMRVLRATLQTRRTHTESHLISAVGRRPLACPSAIVSQRVSWHSAEISRSQLHWNAHAHINSITCIQCRPAENYALGRWKRVIKKTNTHNTHTTYR